jgi:hypothetical protein
MSMSCALPSCLTSKVLDIKFGPVIRNSTVGIGLSILRFFCRLYYAMFVLLRYHIYLLDSNYIIPFTKLFYLMVWPRVQSI